MRTDLQPDTVQVEYVLTQPAGRKVLQHKRIARRWLIGDQVVGRLDAELRFGRPCGRTPPQPGQLLTHQILAPRLYAGRQSHPFRPREDIRRVAAVIRVDGAVVYLPRPGAHRVEKPAVVAHHHQRLGAPRVQVLGEPADDLDVEMVRRFVEHDDVVSGDQHRGQRHPPSLSAGQPADPAVEIDAGQQVRHHVTGIGFGGPHVVRATAHDDVPDRRVAEVVALPQIAHRQPRRMGDPARIGLTSAREHLQQCRLAVAVASDDADRVALVDPQAHGVEQRAGSVADARALDIDQVGHQAPMIGRR